MLFIDLAMARPRSRPAPNIRRGVGAPPVSTTTASIQNAFQRLSVRYSSDFRKNAGATASSSVDQAAMRVS